MLLLLKPAQDEEYYDLLKWLWRARNNRRRALMLSACAISTQLTIPPADRRFPCPYCSLCIYDLC